MKPAEVRELSSDDLSAKLKEARAELFNLRFQMATSQLDNTARVGQVKKDIARIQTEMRARERRPLNPGGEEEQWQKKPATPARSVRASS